MLQHQQETQTHCHLNQPSIASADKSVEEYLNQLWAPAASAQDAAVQLQSHAEMRTHIESLIEANMELGDSEEQAVEHALKQFGNTYTLQREWKRINSIKPT